MNNKWQLALIIPFALLLQSCAFMSLADVISSTGGGSPGFGGRYQVQCESGTAFKPLASILAIAILEIPEPPHYDSDAKHAPPDAEYEDLSFGNTAQAFLKGYLEENGFEVIEYSPNRENEHRLVGDYASLDIKGADAYLDVVPIKVEYHIRDEIKREPVVWVSFRLVTADSNETIDAGFELYDAPEEHIYESTEATEANNKEASERLIQSIETASLRIANRIFKLRPESNLSNNELSEHGPGFTGTYVSTITGPTQDLPTKCKDPVVKLSQLGKNISGTFGCSECLIWGEIEDGIIGYKYQSSDGSTGTGKWTVRLDSREITGEWISSRVGEGEWNLVRIR